MMNQVSRKKWQRNWNEKVYYSHVLTEQYVWGAILGSQDRVQAEIKADPGAKGELFWGSWDKARMAKTPKNGVLVSCMGSYLRGTQKEIPGRQWKLGHKDHWGGSIGDLHLLVTLQCCLGHEFAWGASVSVTSLQVPWPHRMETEAMSPWRSQAKLLATII